MNTTQSRQPPTHGIWRDDWYVALGVLLVGGALLAFVAAVCS